ncbi:MAG: ClpXP protease specificity-enhancing factor [Gammaproteobacteria bacterium]|nr:ClpXP protease specificity-enhancing factor [Gammaproteobacteria bacterium]
MVDSITTDQQPYLLRAIHQWILDNDLTPHILVNAEAPDVDVPAQFVQNGQIVLNIAPHAISNELIDNEAISFSARFSGVVQSLYIPIKAVRAIYASENGEGMAFPEVDLGELETDELDVEDSNEPPTEDPPPNKKTPFLKVVK